MNQNLEPTVPGIVVLSSSLQLQYVNQRAIHLLTQLGRPASRLGADWNLAASLHPHCQDIIETMRERLASRKFEPFHRYRAIGGPKQEILLKGFGLPDRRGWPYSRIVILLLPHVRVSMAGPSPSKTTG